MTDSSRIVQLSVSPGGVPKLPVPEAVARSEEWKGVQGPIYRFNVQNSGIGPTKISAVRVTVEWMQALDLYVPVQRFEVLIRRRKGERMVRLDWHPLVRMAEPLLCEAGLGLDRARLVCDDKLHLTDPAGQAPCASCGKPFCRACFPAACPRCRQAN